jgi:CxxC-x17-CxxC domain-containing protein
MTKFSNNSRSSDKRTGGGRNYGSRSVGENTMHEAICANCGDSCEVPFLPKGKKPVYCKKCFKKFGKGDVEGGLAEEQRMYPATCGNCGNECTVPFRPVQGKPVFCKDCFGKYKGAPSQDHSSGTGSIEEQLLSIQTKLDTIIRSLSPRTTRSSRPTRDFNRAGGKPTWRKGAKKRY